MKRPFALLLEFIVLHIQIKKRYRYTFLLHRFNALNTAFTALCFAPIILFKDCVAQDICASPV